ncbi:MAG: hypothetical protein NTY77_18380 [Elusimicrobia bacterium]|nr:hypothetical protein [Elusimicrobiota bacterium]
MKRLVSLALAALWAGCAAPKPAAKGPEPAAVQTPPAAASANFELKAYEVVGTPEEDTLEYVQIYVGGALQGRTETAAKSRPKLWLGRIAEGNHPMRFEVWDSSDGVSGLRRPDGLQPAERFFRVEPGKKTTVTLKFTDQGRQSLFYVTREPK